LIAVRVVQSIAVALVLLCGGCVQTPQPLEHGTPLPPELARVLTDYESAWHAQDAAQLAELFVDDGFVLSSGHPPVQGRAAIREFYTGKGGALALRPIAWSSSGSLGYIIGGYAKERGQPDLGKFTLTLSRTRDGRWEIVSDMDNGNT
jgi:ketosteroid isomerase-like protein